MIELPPIAVSVQELMDLVAHHVGTITGALTPELATALLTLNQGNRPMSPVAVERFRTIAATGAWINTGEPIIVSRDALLNDGQHRLQGIADSGVTVLQDVRFGVAREVFQATGSGARRTAAHSLHILGKDYSPTQAAIAKLLFIHDGKLFGSRSVVETPDIVRVVSDNPDIGIIAKFIQGTKFTPTRAAGFGFPLVLAARVAPMDRVLEFADLAATGLTDAPKNAARMLHERLLIALMKQHRLGQVEVASITARAWNAWIEGRDVRQLKVLPTDKSGQFFPKVIGPPETGQ